VCVCVCKCVCQLKTLNLRNYLVTMHRLCCIIMRIIKCVCVFEVFLSLLLVVKSKVKCAIKTVKYCRITETVADGFRWTAVVTRKIYE